ncbi:hypothetical protein M427DRAFT_133121 [Gonapodya prolifera JEL478]|uniref:Uncharacterized protein n=1 Tax=Gonapodya prolifera (strain JEL478) TaxID=1344416 RepID=A0A139AMI6_GONPJ|nr:hypothetical protein M427DRAFT_133121 [Gonapodya prolifera JEL478]|eukprot:KXS17982.1 hypothetical protein M427DRAFT_133121 [Gonapodya prolifera JEL478]
MSLHRRRTRTFHLDRRWAFFFPTLLAFLTLSSTIVSGQSYLPINWSQVSSSPQPTNYNRDYSPCPCDLTSNFCDPQCCCDPDCTSSLQAAVFRGDCQSAIISASSNPSATVPLCSNFLAIVNANRMGLEAGVARAADGALCVAIDNNPTVGFFYQPPAGLAPPITSDATFESLFSAFPYSYFPGVPDPGDGAAVSTTDPYKYGIPVQVLYAAPGVPLTGPFPLPAPIAGGECADTVGLGFLVSTSSSCYRVVNLTAACGAGTELDAAYYLKSVVQTVSSTPTTIAVQPSSAPRVPSMVGAVCNNVVAKVAYTFLWSLASGTPSVVSVSVEFGYTNISAPVSGSPYIAVGQKFSASWGEGANTPLPLSGHPGYIFGRPVLFATSTSSAVGVSSVLFDSDPTSGITMPAMVFDRTAGILRCTSGSPEDRARRVVVGFGEDVSAGCTFDLSYTDLTSSCPSIRAAVWQAVTGYADPATMPDRVGSWGNSSWQDPAGWVPILGAAPAAGRSAAPSTIPGLCSDVLVSFSLEFLWTDLGSRLNPQPTIVGSRARYVLGSLQYRCESPADCQGVGASVHKQQFLTRASVTFVRVGKEGARAYVPPAPRLLPPLPRDVFYPFTLL